MLEHCDDLLPSQESDNSQQFNPFASLVNSVANRSRLYELTPTSSTTTEDPFLSQSSASANSAAALSQPLHQAHAYWSSLPTFITDESMMFSQPIDISSTAPHILGGGTINDSFRAFPSVISDLSLVQMSQSQPPSQMVPTYTDSQPMVYFDKTQFSSQAATLPYDDSQHASHGGLPYNVTQPPAMIPVRPYASQPTMTGKPYDTQPAMVGGLPHDGAALTSRTKQCANCQAMYSPTWRRHKRTQLNVCNACGLYYNLHAKEREFAYNARGQRVVKRQPRGSGRRNQRNRVTNPLNLAPSAPQPAHSSVPQHPGQSSAPQHPVHSSVPQIPNYSTTVNPVTSGMEYMNASYVSSQLTHYMATQNSYQDNTTE